MGPETAQEPRRKFDSHVEALSADTVAVMTASPGQTAISSGWSEFLSGGRGEPQPKNLFEFANAAQFKLSEGTRGVRHNVPRPPQIGTKTGSVD